MVYKLLSNQVLLIALHNQERLLRKIVHMCRFTQIHRPYGFKDRLFAFQTILSENAMRDICTVLPFISSNSLVPASCVCSLVETF